MKKLMELLEKYFVPIAAKIGSQRHLVAIRDGFATIMPIIIAGSLAILINNIPIQPYQDFMTKVFPSWKSFGGNIWNGSFAILSLLTLLTVSYNLARSYNSNGIGAVMVSFGSLLMLYAGSANDWAIPYAYLGPQGLFVALFVALIATEIYVKLLRSKALVIKMPDSVPPAVSKSFASLFPTLIVLAIFSAVRMILVAIGVNDLHQLIFTAIQNPLMGLSNNIWSALLVVFLVHLLWFFGLHGTNILLPITAALFIPAIEFNMAAIEAGKSLPYIVTAPFFDAFIYMGGAGSTLCLIISLFIVGKSKQYRIVRNLSTAPGLFNINEPMLYGMPLVLNPMYVIPFIFAPLAMTVTSFLATAIGIVPRTIATMPWVTPPIIGGFLVTGSIMGSLLALVNIAIGVAIYLPFVLVADKGIRKLESEEKAA